MKKRNELEIVERNNPLGKIVDVHSFTQTNKTEQLIIQKGYLEKRISDIIANALRRDDSVSLRFV